MPTPLAQILARTRTVTKHRFLELVSDAVGDDAELLRRGLASARKQLQAQGLAAALLAVVLIDIFSACITCILCGPSRAAFSPFV